MTQHINPGTDTAINPVVVDDSYREKKKHPLRCETCTDELCAFYEKKWGTTWHSDIYYFIMRKGCASRTPAHPPEAQRRIKQIDKKLCQLGDTIHEIQYAGKVSAEVINDLDSVLETYREVREAIALLQAGRK